MYTLRNGRIYYIVVVNFISYRNRTITNDIILHLRLQINNYSNNAQINNYSNNVQITNYLNNVQINNYSNNIHINNYARNYK